MKSRAKYYLVALFMMILMGVGQPAGPLSAGASDQVVAPIGDTYGATYGEWSARWWQWVLSIPTAVNPNLDATGGNGAQGQYDDVWFLAGQFGGPPVVRTVHVPADKPIFFPVINVILTKPFGYETLLDLRKQAAAIIDSVTELEATLDGQALSSFRVRSPAFTVNAPAKGVIPPGQLTVPGNTDPLVSDGYWLLLNPLSTGSHTLTFKGKTTEPKPKGFAVDVTYTLIVP